jgi:hypothetical protein
MEISRCLLPACLLLMADIVDSIFHTKTSRPGQAKPTSADRCIHSVAVAKLSLVSLTQSHFSASPPYIRTSTYCTSMLASSFFFLLSLSPDYWFRHDTALNFVWCEPLAHISWTGPNADVKVRFLRLVLERTNKQTNRTRQVQHQHHPAICIV